MMGKELSLDEALAWKQYSDNRPKSDAELALDREADRIIAENVQRILKEHGAG